MSFFGDLKIILSYMFTRKSKTKEEKKSSFSLSKLLDPDIKDKKYLYNYGNSNTFVLNKSIRKYDEFTTFAFVEDGKLILTDSIKVKLDYSLEPRICINNDTGYDVGVYKEDTYFLIKEHYNKHGVFIGNDKNNKGREVSYNSIPYVSYKLSRDKLADVIVEYKSAIIYRVGTILRRHKTSGHGYYVEHKNHLETIANLMYFKPVDIKVKTVIGDFKYLEFVDKNLYRIALDVVNDTLLFIDCAYGYTKASPIKSVSYELDKTNKSTRRVILNMKNGDTIYMRAPKNCFLHNKNF